MQEVLRQEIADTDGAHCAFIIEPLQSTPAFRYQRLPICAGEGQGPMNEEQIQILHLQIFEGGFKACHGFIIAQVRFPDLRGQEQLSARDAALPQGVADHFFVFVSSGGVNMAVAGC